MASISSPTRRLFLFCSLLFFAIGANARPGVHFHPCKTLLISSFTFSSSSSIKPHFEFSQNPNPIFADNQNPSEILAIFSEINGFDDSSKQQPFEIFVERRPDFVSFDSASSRFMFRRGIPFRRHFDSNRPIEIQKPIVPYRSSSFGGVSSLRERTKDILSVVVALLFGAGCGALTSATMYLAWSLITNRYEYQGTEDDDSDSDDDISSSKMGYVKIPSAAPVPVPAPAPAPAPAKEVV